MLLYRSGEPTNEWKLSFYSQEILLYTGTIFGHYGWRFEKLTDQWIKLLDLKTQHFQNCGLRLFEYLFSTDRCLKTKEKLLRLMIFSHDFTFLAGFQMTTFLYMFVIELLCFPWKLITFYQDVGSILTWNSFRKKNRTKNLDELKRSTQISIWQRLK